MRNIIITIILLFPLAVFGNTLDWHSGGKVSYSLQKKCSPVVSKAIQLLDASLKAGSGERLEENSKSKSRSIKTIAVYQLDKASNKEMKALGSLQVPIMKFIARKDAFWIGVREGRMVVAGSNGRGTAYGLLELSKLPAMIDDNYESLQIPSVEYRGIDLERYGDIDYTHLFETMLRLRANTLCEGWDEGDAPSHFLRGLRTMAEEYGIVLATPHDGKSIRLTEHKSNKSVDLVCHDDNYGYMEFSVDGDKDGGAVYHLSYSGEPHDYLWLCTTQPGLIANEMKTAFSNGADKLWMVAVKDPMIVPYQLDLFMDMAWDVNSVKVGNVRQHLHDWIAREFGKEAADYLLEPLSQYFRLVGIRRPEFMDFTRQQARSKSNKNGDGGVRNTEFNAEEFGNELERYLNDYTQVCQKVKSAGTLVNDALKDDFFLKVEYPVYCSALMATKILQSQESRLIGRPVSFHHDSEALESAVRSIKAYHKIQELTSRYNEIIKKDGIGMDMDSAPHSLAVFGEPKLTDKLSEVEIKKYDHYDALDARLENDNTIVRNASEYSKASDGAFRVDLLGRSLKSVDLYSGDVLTYSFNTDVLGGVLRLAFIPTHAIDGGSLQCSVSIDGATPRTIIITDGSHSERWADGVLRGQSVITLPVSLSSGSHTLSIKALSDHVILDQWMIDKDTDRQFYIMPR